MTKTELNELTKAAYTLCSHCGIENNTLCEKCIIPYLINNAFEDYMLECKDSKNK